MSCENIHNELKNMEEIICPFCNEEIGEHTIKKESCCSEQNIENRNGKNVCLSCGSVHGYSPFIEYVDFYQNKHRFYRKSVYQRKYHIENIINNIKLKNNFQITIKNKDKILRIFKEIGTVVNLVNKNRKRMINLNFIFKQIFIMLSLPHDVIKISKSKKTIKKYNQYWIDILLLIFDKIIKIIQE